MDKFEEQDKMRNNSFNIQFNSSNKTFSPKFSQKEWESKPKVEPNVTSPEEIYYDEIVIYGGGGVDGYGDS